MNRDSLRTTYIEQIGWSDAKVEALPVDASFRCYFRLSGDGASAILMDAPPEHEDVPLFVRLADHLRGIGLSTPRILAPDNGNGFLLLEDFGQDTFTHLLAGGYDEWRLYELAVDVLAQIQAAPDVTKVDVGRYDEEMLLREVGYITEWLWLAQHGESCPVDIEAEFIAAWQGVFRSVPELPSTLVIRDFHVDNLMLLPDRSGVAQCGLLDFQGAVIGNPAYDLLSLVEDARRDIDDRLRETMKRRYYNRLGVNDAVLRERWYHVMGAQRHSKVLGLFVRLWLRDGKPKYLSHLPRVAGLLRQHLDHDDLGPVRDWFDAYLPDYGDVVHDGTT